MSTSKWSFSSVIWGYHVYKDIWHTMGKCCDDFHIETVLNWSMMISFGGFYWVYHTSLQLTLNKLLKLRIEGFCTTVQKNWITRLLNWSKSWCFFNFSCTCFLWAKQLFHPRVVDDSEQSYLYTGLGLWSPLFPDLLFRGGYSRTLLTDPSGKIFLHWRAEKKKKNILTLHTYRLPYFLE